MPCRGPSIMFCAWCPRTATCFWWRPRLPRTHSWWVSSVPGDLAVVIGGGLAAGAKLGFLPVVLSVTVGGWLGACLSFWIGRRGGVPLIERWGSRLSIGHAQVQGVERYFEAHGAKTVFLATFVAGFKNLVPALAGASNMGFGRFFGYSAAGTALRAFALVGVGYLFGQNLPRALEVIGKANGWLLALIVSALILLVVVRLIRALRSRRNDSGAKGQNRVDRGVP